ncbi:TCF3 fusion partner [Amia ocellicauda]|uniref:TCF3 fusion partner n=1 Tax=Amia ocellicauda TaxID=2972642 RepID=UPI003463FBDE
MEDFSGLALPPLFGGNILEAELETEGVEYVDEGGVTEVQGSLEEGLGEREGQGVRLLQEREREEEREKERERERRKYLTLSQRCREIEQVNERILGRLHQVHRLTRRLKKERRFLMKTLSSYGDDFRNAQLTILLEEEGGTLLDSAPVGEEESLLDGPSSSPLPLVQSAGGTKRKRHRVPRERETQVEGPLSVLCDPPFSGFPPPSPPAYP